MLLIFAYVPVLIFLPVLLVIGVIAVVVPGGFIVVLVGAYYLSVGFAWLLVMTARAHRRAARALLKRANTESLPAPHRFGSTGTVFVPARTVPPFDIRHGLALYTAKREPPRAP
jgi:membrane protein implicated in regulation of membrane protease activity